MRTITVTVGGEEHTFPTSMNVLRRAEDLSGISTPEALAGDRPMSAAFVQGLVAAGLESTGKKINFEEVGDLIGWDELDGLYTEIMRALAPEPVETSPKNARAEESRVGGGSSG